MPLREIRVRGKVPQIRGFTSKRWGRALAILLEFKHGKAGITRLFYQTLGVVRRSGRSMQRQQEEGPPVTGYSRIRWWQIAATISPLSASTSQPRPAPDRYVCTTGALPAEGSKAAVVGLRLLGGADDGIALGGSEAQLLSAHRLDDAGQGQPPDKVLHRLIRPPDVGLRHPARPGRRPALPSAPCC